jgi:DNA polymerase I-like protein with 3'-5' exonuclease and polymerase domains
LFTLIENLTQVPEFQKELFTSDALSIDTESSGLDIYATTWLLLQVKTNNKIFIFDVRKLGSRNITYIINLIKSSDKLILLHNAKFDLKIIYLNTGIMLTNVYDSMVTEVLINQGVGKQFYSLKELVEKYCNVVLDKEAREGFYNYQEDSFSNELLTYSALDVNYLDTIYQEHMRLIFESNQKKTYDLEMRLVAPVADMEINGVILDRNAWIALIKTAELKIESSKKEIIDYILSHIDFKKYNNALETAKELLIPIKTKKMEKALELISNPEAVIDWFRDNLNIGSPLQIKRLFNLLGIPLESTGENELKKIRLTTPLADLLLIHREATKKITTYGEKFLENINVTTGKIHSEFNQVGTQSGRFSSDSPNLQNIPKEEEYRHCFVAGEGKVFLCKDYSQQEYRLAGAVSKERKIIEAYQKGLDMHSATASAIFEIPIEEVTKEQRDKGKTINFSILYGSTKYGLAYKLQVDINVAEIFLQQVEEAFPNLSLFKEMVSNEIWKRKYSCTPLGRKRYFAEKVLFSDYKEAQAYESKTKREGFNHIVQGGGADAVKIAMCDIYYNNPFGDKLKLKMQIHDELVTEADESIAKEADAFVTNCMINALQPFLGEIPAKVEGPISKVWRH